MSVYAAAPPVEFTTCKDYSTSTSSMNGTNNRPINQPINQNMNSSSGKGFYFKFKMTYPDPSERRKECNKILAQFPGKVPIICEKDPISNIKYLIQTKYIVPKDLTVSQFNMMIRKKIELSKEASLYLLINGKTAITGDCLISEIYEKNKDPEDGILYIVYASELTWGNN